MRSPALGVRNALIVRSMIWNVMGHDAQCCNYVPHVRPFLLEVRAELTLSLVRRLFVSPARSLLIRADVPQIHCTILKGTLSPCRPISSKSFSTGESPVPPSRRSLTLFAGTGPSPPLLSRARTDASQSDEATHPAEPLRRHLSSTRLLISLRTDAIVILSLENWLRTQHARKDGRDHSFGHSAKWLVRCRRRRQKADL